MSIVTWTGNALDRKQINTITVANTWAAGDTATMTINGKDLVVTVGATGTSTANVAIAIKEAWESVTRLDGTATTDATSNAGGQEFGEFAEVAASVSGSVVTLVANKGGRPFTLTVTEATVGTGTATGAVATTATGKNHWNDADNWDTGSVPVNDDTVVFRDTNISCRYGLPNGSLEVTMQVWMSFTGEIGLPSINADNPAQPYYEYRQRYVRLDDAGGGTNIAHRFGLGKDGTGPTLINLKHSTLKCSPIVYNTGPPFVSRVGTKALNICCTNNTSTLAISGGSVDYSSQDGSTSAFANFFQTGGDSRGVTAFNAASINISGGNALIGGTAGLGVVFVSAGNLRLENQTASITALTISDSGYVDYASTATITSMIISGGTFDARNSIAQFNIGVTSVYRGAKFFDPYRNRNITTSFSLFFDPSPDLLFGASAVEIRIS